MVTFEFLPSLNSLRDRKNIIPMVFAEIINDFNYIHEHLDSSFTGGPLLLKMWLLDHLGLFSIPSSENVAFRSLEVHLFMNR